MLGNVIFCELYINRRRRYEYKIVEGMVGEESI